MINNRINNGRLQQQQFILFPLIVYKYKTFKACIEKTEGCGHPNLPWPGGQMMMWHV